MLLLSEPKAPGGYTFATGNVGTFADVLDAAWDNGRYAWNANSRWRALEEAYDRRIKGVQEATGQTLDNPLRAVPSADDYREIARRTKASGKALYLPDYMAEKFQRQLARIAEGAPDKLGVLRPHVPVVADAVDIARGSEEKLNDVLSRTSGLTGTLANLAGGVGAAFEDPATYALAPVGLSGSASKSLLWNALRAAASNAAGQAVIEPFIQQWRAEAGLEAGFLPGLKDVAFAGAVGGGLDFTVRGLVRGGKYVTGANLPTPPELPRGATIEDAIARLPDDNPIKAAAKGDDAALVVAAQQIEGHLTTAERGALRSLEDDLNLGRTDGAKIKIDAGEDLAAIAQAIRHAEDPHLEPMPVHEPMAKAEPVAIDPKDEVAVRLSEGRGTAIETASVFRARPELAAAVPMGGKARTAKSLARLDEPAFDMVRRGAVKESWGALVGDLVADPAEHVPVLERLAERRPERLADARRIIAEETVKPAKPRAIAEALGGGEATPAETALQHVAHAIQSGTVPAKRAREALKRRMATIADDAGPEPAPRGLDEPAGPEAKAEVEAKLKQVKSRLGKGLDQITKETKGGQAAVDRVAGRGGKPKFSLSPKAAAALPDIRAKLNEAAALLPKAVRIRLYDTLTFGQLPERIRALAPAGVEEKTIAGLWDAEEMVIHLSLSTGDPLKTLRHEQVHMMRALGLLTDDDYRRLVRHAEKTDARKTFKIDATYGEPIKAQYPDKAAAEAVLVEETVAHLVAERLAGKPIGGGLDKILKPIRDFLRKIRDALGLKGLRTVEDVFDEIAHGGHRFDPPSTNPKHPAWDRLSRELRDAQKTGAKLPEQSDPRMVRARELGFDTTKVWYRGTNSNRQAERFRVSQTYGVVYVTSDPKVANRFARQEVGYLGRAKIDEGARVYPLLLRTQRLFDPTNAAQAKKLRLALQKQGVQISRQEMAANLEGLNEAFLERADVQDALKQLGFSGYLSQQLNVNDSAALFDPAELRSLWAEFAPAKAGEDGLLFSLSPDDAEAALGVRLGDAELRDSVAGAARKLSGNVDMQAAWIEGMGLEQGDAEEIVKLYTGFLRDFSKIMDASTAKRLAREEVAKLLETEALHRKRVALLQLEATTRVREALSTHKNARGEVDPAQAMIGHLEHYGLEGTPITSSVEGRRKAILGMAQSQMDKLLWTFRKRGSVGRMNLPKMEAVVRELFDENSGDAAAKELAKAWSETAEGLRQRFNRAGGAVGKLEKWGLPQAHNPSALRNRGFAQWRADILPLLDPAKMRHPISGQPMTTAQVDESLRRVFDRIVTDGAVDAPLSPSTGGSGALHKQHAEHRFLVFNDADAWLKYQRLYGAGGADGIFATMMNHVNIMARDIAAMEVLGPNPNLTIEAMMRFVQQQTDLAVGKRPALFPTKSPIGLPSWRPEDYGARHIEKAREMWSNINGSANVPANSLFANTMSAIRNITFGTTLGSAMLSSVSDLGRQQITRRFAGVYKSAHSGRDLRGVHNPFVVLADIVQQFKGENRREALAAGLIMESAVNVMHGQARYIGSFDGPVLTRRYADRMLTWAGLTPWTQAGRHVFGLSAMKEFAANVGKRFADLDPGLQMWMKRYGLGEAEWDEIRQFTPSVMGDADAFLRGRQPGADAFPKNPTPSTIRDAGKVMAGSVDAPDLEPIRYLKPTDIKNRALAERYLEMILQETERAVPSGTVANRAFWVGSNKPGTIKGELLRNVSMLKAYSAIVMMQDTGRIAQEIAAGRKMRGGRYAASVLVSMTIYGALAMQLKGLSRGEDPRPMDNEKFWGAAMLQGGGLGLFGDYLFGQVNRFGGSWGDAALGPVASRASNLWNLTAGNVIQFGQDEPTNAGREAVQFARLNVSVPFYLRLAYERVLLDELQKVADPEAYQAFRRKASKLKSQFKTGYWWAPGETGPRRAPDLGNLAP